VNIKVSKGLIYTFPGAILWAFSIVIVRYILNHGENPYTLVFWSSLISFPVWLLLFCHHLADLKKLTYQNYGLLCLIGVISSIGIDIIEVLALKYTTAVNFSFLIRSIVLFTIIFAWIFFKEKITAKKLVLVFLILAGSFLLTTQGKGFVFQKGDIFTLIEAATIAFVNNILVKVTVSKMHPDLSAAGTSLFSLLPIVIIAFLNNAIRFPIFPFWIALNSLLMILFLRLRNRGYQVSTASFVTMILSFTPVMVCFLSVLILKEGLTLIQAFGGIMIISTGILAEKLKI
jgi:drug/metabolite transporter (DMT)-like permease